MDPTDFEMRYMGQFKKRHGLVYPDFCDLHLFEEKPNRPISKVIAGIDWGFTNPAAIIVIAIDYDRHYWLTEEVYLKGKTTGELVSIAKNLQSKHRINIFYADSAEPDRIEEARRANLYVTEANKDIKLGIDIVRQAIRENRFHVHRSLKNTIEEFENYHYPEQEEAGFIKDLPKKEDDHLMDAIRYALFTDDPRPVDFDLVRKVQENRKKQFQYT
jgi:phage terminase large subunit